MKKLSTSVSPFIMLIVPVMFAILLTLTFKANSNDSVTNLSSAVSSKSIADKLVETGESSVIRFLLR